MKNLVRQLWDSAAFRGVVLLFAIGSAPVVLLSYAVAALERN